MALSNAGGNSQCDCVGPVDPVSKLRPTKIFIPTNESDLEKQHRLRRESVWRWNQKFWTRHNTSFYEERAKFVEATMEANKLSGPQDIQPEKMSQFYKKFLDDRWRLHLQYNWRWYKINIGLLWPSAKVALIKLLSNARRLK